MPEIRCKPERNTRSAVGPPGRAVFGALLSAVLLVALNIGLARADSISWTGGTWAQWDVASNWTDNTTSTTPYTPQTGDVATFAGSAYAYGTAPGNTITWDTLFQGGHLSLWNYFQDPTVTIASTGTAEGYGTIDQWYMSSYGTATLINNGLINANSSGNTFTLNVANLTNTGTLKAENSGTLAIYNALTNSGTLQTSTGGTINLYGTMNTGGGTSALDTTGGGSFVVDGGQFGGSVNGTGSSTVTFTNNANNQIINATLNANVALGSGFVSARGTSALNGTTDISGGRITLWSYFENPTLTNGTGDLIQGYGTIDQSHSSSYGTATFVNNGTVDANSVGNTLALSVANITNTDTLKADGGTLAIYGNNLTNSGTLRALNGGAIDLGCFLNTGGGTTTVDTTGGGSILIDGANLNGTINGVGATTLEFNGNVANHIGEYAGVTMNANVDVGSGFVRTYGADSLNQNTTIAGGHIQLWSYFQNPTLTIGPSGVLSGYGTVDASHSSSYGTATLINNGVIDTASSGNTLALGVANITNNGLMKAENGATLDISGQLTLAGTGTLKADTGGTIYIDSLLNSLNGTLDTTSGAGAVWVRGANVTGTLNGVGSSTLNFDGNSANTVTNAILNTNVGVGNGFFEAVGANSLNGTTTMTGGHIQLWSYFQNPTLTIGPSGLLTGYGTIDASHSNSYGYSTLVNNGVIDSDPIVKVLTISVSDVVDNGTMKAENGGELVVTNQLDLASTGLLKADTGGSVILNGLLNGLGGNLDTSGGAGSIWIKGGNVTGTVNGVGSSALQFDGNANNFISSATLNSNVAIGSGFVGAYNNNTLNGTTTISGGNILLHNYFANPTLTVGPSGVLEGYGTINTTHSSSYGSASLVNNGTIDANVAGQTLDVATTVFTNNGNVNVSSGATLAVVPDYQQNSGATKVDGTLQGSGGTFHLDGGILSGTGTVTGENVVNNGGTVKPGDSPGTLTLTGAYTQGAAGALDIAIAGTSDYSKLFVQGPVSLDGALDVTWLSGFSVTSPTTFDILNYSGMLNGTFASVNLNPSLYTWNIDYGSGTGGGDVLLTIDGIPAPVPEGQSGLSLGLLLSGFGVVTLLQRRRQQAR